MNRRIRSRIKSVFSPFGQTYKPETFGNRVCFFFYLAIVDVIATLFIFLFFYCGHTCKQQTIALFGWLIQPDSASHNSIFLSREISQPFSQQYFPLTRNQPASQSASQPNKPMGAHGSPARFDRTGRAGRQSGPPGCLL